MVKRIITNSGPPAAPLVHNNGEVAAYARVMFELVTADLKKPTDVWDAISFERITGQMIVVELDKDGLFPSGFGLWPNSRGNVSTLYRCRTNIDNTHPFLCSVSAADIALSWAELYASGTPLTPQELTQLGIHEASPVHLPANGTIGQALVKASNSSYDVEWADSGAIYTSLDGLRRYKWALDEQDNFVQVQI